MKTPKRHAIHSNGRPPCGCWVGQKEPTVDCEYCGATYLADDVAEFPVWRCYDCGGRVFKRAAIRALMEAQSAPSK
jgi:DNA-directed RNA polymerase subunit RPC12/RpoP